MDALAAAPQPIGIFEHFIARQQETIVVDEKFMSMSGDSFDIKLANGAPLLKAQGHTFSLSGRKEISDMAGNHLYTISQKVLSLKATFIVETPSGQQIMEIKNSFMTLIGSKATITFTSKSGKAERFVMNGNWRSSKADIADEATGFVMARIKRDRSLKHYVGGSQTYTVDIAPGVDMALVVAMCIAMDEKNNDK